MKYEIEKWNDRTVFVLKDTTKTFEDILEIIDKKTQPNYRNEVETTSWTMSLVFSKKSIDIYLEYFYAYGKTSCTFELFPLGKCDEVNFLKIKNIIDDLCRFL